MDSEGYPEEKELRMIRKWDIKDFPTLLQFVEERWTYHDFIKREVLKKDFLQWTLITGGWSGNESLVNALLGNQFFEMHWYYEWRRGGKHVFRIDPRNVGYFLVKDYCEQNGVTRQYISKAKNKFEYFKLSPNKIFIRPISVDLKSKRAPLQKSPPVKILTPHMGAHRKVNKKHRN